jgi:hypothetical protein
MFQILTFIIAVEYRAHRLKWKSHDGTYSKPSRRHQASFMEKLVCQALVNLHKHVN